MRPIILPALFVLIGCAPTPYLVFSNRSSHSIVVSVTPQTKNDTLGTQLGAFTIDSLIASTFGKANAVDQAELRAIIVRDSTGHVEQVLRMSASYLIEQGWKIKYPIPTPCDTCYRKINRATAATDAFHLAQELYNARKYLDCITVSSSGANLDALTSRRTSRDPYVSNDYDEGYARYQGYLLLIYLSARNTKNDMLAQTYWHKIESEAPHVARNLQQYDVEFAR